jgi:hypothetical protein
MTPEDLFIQEGLSMKVPALAPSQSLAQCNLCEGPYDTHAVRPLLRKADEHTGPLAKQHHEEALFVRYAGLCQTCAHRAVGMGKTIEIPTGGK